MTERREEYTGSSIDARTIPRRWLKFLHRIAGLEAGKAYTITIFMPKQRDGEATWFVADHGYIENQK